MLSLLCVCVASWTVGETICLQFHPSTTRQQKHSTMSTVEEQQPRVAEKRKLEEEKAEDVVPSKEARVDNGKEAEVRAQM